MNPHIPTSPHRCSAREAFTLIELLTVIAIIGLLAAIIIPVASTVRRRANTAADTSNLRQIGQCVQLYIADNKGFMPSNTRPIPGTATSSGSFHEAVDRYFGPGPNFNPSAIDNFKNRGNMWFSPFAQPYTGFAATATMPMPVAYGYNLNTDDDRWKRLSNVPNPAKYVFVGEINDSVGYQVDGTQPPVGTDDTRTSYRINRSGAALYLFCDGHAEKFTGNLSESALAATGKTNIWKWW